MIEDYVKLANNCDWPIIPHWPILPHTALGPVSNFQFPLSNTYISELGEYMGFPTFEAWNKTIFSFVKCFFPLQMKVSISE